MIKITQNEIFEDSQKGKTPAHTTHLKNSPKANLKQIRATKTPFSTPPSQNAKFDTPILTDSEKQDHAKSTAWSSKSQTVKSPLKEIAVKIIGPF